MTTWNGAEPLKISNSEMQLFLEDRRVWWLSYYRGLRKKVEYSAIAGPLGLGSKIHLALEMSYSLDTNPLEILKRIYDDERQGFADRDIPAENLTAYDKEQDLAHIMIAGFVDWVEENGIDDGLEIVGQEEVVQVKSHIDNVFWRGKMDQRVVRKSDHARLFRDFKTAADFSAEKMLAHDPQMKFYHLLEYMQAMQESGAEPQWRTDGALYLMLRKVKRTATAKPPFYKQLEVHHNIHEIRNTYKYVAKITEEIVETRNALDAGGDFHYLCPPRPNRDWTWKNPFFDVMALIDDGSDFEGMLSEYYEVVDPDARYQEEEVDGKG